MTQLIQKQKTTFSRSRPRDLLEQFHFTLPNHIRLSSRRNSPPGALTRVTGDIYRLKEAKIKICSAKPLSVDEEVQRAMRAYCSPMSDKGVVLAAAEAEIALSNLAMLARKGNGKALWQFARIAHDVTESLGQMARTNPMALRPFSRNCTRWPMMRSTHPLNSERDKLLQEIELGKSTGVQLDKFSKWKPDYASNVAGRLMTHIEHIRKENPICLDGKQKIEFSKFLPPFSKQTAQQWWFIAKKFLLASYPKPECVKELNQIATSPTKRKSLGRVRAAILEKIRTRFFNLACQS